MDRIKKRFMKNYYFNYIATLRIFGIIENINEISNLLDLEPTYSHKIGEKTYKVSKPHEFDMWMYESNIPEEELEYNKRQEK